MNRFVSEISLIAVIDGKNCAKPESTLGYPGLILWVLLTGYMMVGQYVIAEAYFVPGLEILGNRLGLSESAQGATLLAAGSSAPELVTAVIGVLLFPNDNPGPGTNVGSAVFNMCTILGFSAYTLHMNHPIDRFPFFRDTISYIISLIFLLLVYQVISPLEVELWESVMLTILYCIYFVVVIKSEQIAAFFGIEMEDTTSEMSSYVNMNSVDVRQRNSTLKVQTRPMGNSESYVVPLHLQASVQSVAPKKTVSYISIRSTSVFHEESTLAYAGEIIRKPFEVLFAWTIPEVGGDFFNNHMIIFLMMVLFWLIILTWLIVDLAEKIGNCLSIPSDVLGLTLLAVGSSLPDVMSAVLVAKNGAVDMAISTCYGSNVFDVGFAFGFSFLIGNLARGGKPLPLGDGGNAGAFTELLIFAIALQVAAWVLAATAGTSLVYWHGHVYNMMYVAFLVFFLVRYFSR